MLFSESPIRRYTPPTCTLEIWAKGSPLSRWLGRVAVNDWRFALHFDDPRLPEVEQVTLRGSREELELLSEAVSNYLQNFLGQTGRLVSGSETPVPVLVSGMAGAPASAAIQQYLPETVAASALAALPTSPALKSSNWLAHELILGSLAREASQPTVKLSASQLFDLANALENYSVESPTLTANLPNSKARLLWFATGVAVLLAVGSGAIAAWRFGWLQRAADSLASRQNSTSQPLGSNITDVLPPVPPPPLQPIPSPTLPSSLARQKALNPPSAVKPPGSFAIPQIVLPQPNSASPPPPQSQRQAIAIVPQEPERSASAKIASPEISNLPPLSSRPEPTTAAANPQFDSSYGNLARSTAPNPAEATMLLDTIPQVAEARHYFQKRWTAPEGLNQRLEYRLLVNREGSLERIIPLGRAAQIYLDRTGMPLLGESFVSPLQDTEQATVRLVLTPDSKVKTFLE